MLKATKILFLAVLFYSGCKKKEDPVPTTYVDLYIHTNDPSMVGLNAVGGWAYIPGGLKGIILFKRSNEEIAAYERTCTYQVSTGSVVVIDSTNTAAVDKKCGSRFQLYDGSVIKGPASVGLKAYQTSYDGTLLHIYN